MKVKSMVTVGFLAMVAATSVVPASSSFAAETGVERHGVGGSIYSTSRPMSDGAVICAKGEERQPMEVVGIERIGHGGSIYQSKAIQASDCQQGRRVDVVQRIGQGGSTYFSSQTLSN